jgi:ribosome maturation factor RimP
MLDKDLIVRLAEEAATDQNAFLVEVSVTVDNRIKVVADADENINLAQLTKIHRAVEAGLNRDENDFELEVTSPGGAPFLIYRQYQKNLNKLVKVTLLDGTTHTGMLTKLSPDQLEIAFEERVPKEKGKGKMTVLRTLQLDMNQIKETKKEIRF